jgi:hypothetical protein
MESRCVGAYEAITSDVQLRSSPHHSGLYPSSKPPSSSLSQDHVPCSNSTTNLSTMVSTTRSQSQCADQTASASQTLPQSSLDTEQDVVELTWVLFDKSQDRYIPCLIRIPRNLYEQKSFHSRALFVQELHQEYGVTTTANSISFWTVGGASFACFVASELLQQPKEPLSIDAAGEIGWAASVHDFDTYFIPISSSQEFGCRLSADTVANGGIVHIVIAYRNAGSAVGGSDVEGLKEFKRMFTPSCLSGAHSVGRLSQCAEDPRNRTFRSS